MRLPLARGSAEVLVPLGVCSVLAFRLHEAVGWVGLGLFLFSLTFFRDFDRRVPEVDPDVGLAAADGKVVSVTEVYEEAWMGGPCVRISTFMSLFDAHVNRAPFPGRIEYLEHTPGKFLAAYRDEAAEENERFDMGMRVGGRKVLARQVSGLVARRIVNRAKIGRTPAAGERYGMIRFGSRLDLFVPLGSEPLVEVGQQVYAGLTPMVRLSGGAE